MTILAVILILILVTTLIKIHLENAKIQEDFDTKLRLKEIQIKDSLNTVNSELLHRKLDSLIEIHEREISIHKARERELQNRLNAINVDFPELPDLRTDSEKRK